MSIGGPYISTLRRKRGEGREGGREGGRGEGKREGE